MRTVLIPLLLVALPALAIKPKRALFVVVHTVDRVTVDYVCSKQFSETDPNALVFKTQLMSQGAFTWHVTGGTAPYRVINSTESYLGGCVTVVDADGDTASGCGSINQVRVRRNVDCENALDSSQTTFIIPHALPVQKIPLSFSNPVPDPAPGPTPGPGKVDPRGPGKVSPPPPPRTPGPAPRKPDHVTPAPGPSPHVHPPDRPHVTPSPPPVRPT